MLNAYNSKFLTSSFVPTGFVENESFDKFGEENFQYCLSSSVSSVPILPPTNETELQSWDSWGLDESQGRNRVKQESPQPEPEIDFFQGMTPTIKKTTKILIKKKDMDNSDNSSNRLAMNSEFPVSEQELGVWEEALPSWEEASEDLTWQADATIKEKKRAEREARQMEQQRRKIEKESLRAIKKECTFSAVRLS
ncbi:EBAG9 [Acanthosepion pharaonis]|uniref:EBAG9 n=1 Tax=Acanthosepion pharaonis TaxID=158019 RepID=A0A812BZX6_ACAPH|nr:EBAG9 [Sepia pharaonis]